MTTAPTIRFDIFIAGDIATAKQACRSFCFDLGLCVTVEPITYIYTGGEEEGVRVLRESFGANPDVFEYRALYASPSPNDGEAKP